MLKWTTEAPSVAGWYWHRNGNRKRPQMTEVRVVDEPQAPAWNTGAEYRERFSIRENWEPVYKYHKHHWAGPIPTPEDSDA